MMIIIIIIIIIIIVITVIITSISYKSCRNGNLALQELIC